MAHVVTLTLNAHNRDQAEYLVRSRAQQRGVDVLGIDIAAAGPGAWTVELSVDDADTARLVAAALDEDTQVLHFRSHRTRGHPQ